MQFYNARNQIGTLHSARSDMARVIRDFFRIRAWLARERTTRLSPAGVG